MAHDSDETHPLTRPSQDSHSESRDSLDSISTTSAILEQLSLHQDHNSRQQNLDTKKPYQDEEEASDATLLDPISSFDIEDQPGKTYHGGMIPVDKRYRRYLWILGLVCFVGWGLAALLFFVKGNYKHASTLPHDPLATASRGTGKKVTLEEVQSGQWRARRHAISWIAGPRGEDGLLLERGDARNTEYLVVKDVRERDKGLNSESTRVLMAGSQFKVNGQKLYPSEVWPSPNLKKVLILTDLVPNWRHSYTGRYWILDVATQSAEPLDLNNIDGRVQLAQWSPQSDKIVFTRDNNLYIRTLSAKSVKQVTTDGGPDLFYGVPDWVYEEEVFSGRIATWWSEDGKYLAFLRTNETEVPSFPVDYYLSRPSGQQPPPGLENYPEQTEIKYPKAGAPNPTVHLQFCDVAKGDVFSVPIEGDFDDKTRLITEVVWAGRDGKVLVRETNRESDVLKVVLFDVERRTGRTVRERDVQKLDGGWFEVSQTTTFIPPDPVNGRAHAGYIDTVIHEGFDHLAYFTPLDNPEPKLLTSGDWEVVEAPSVVDLVNNYVYFKATKESSIQRHYYRVKLDGTGNIEPITDISQEGYHSISFSTGGKFGLVSYDGPNIPWQRISSMPGVVEEYHELIEENKALQSFASAHELPIENYGTITVDGFDLNYVERLPPHFNKKRKYPVLFWMYQGPNSQSVNKQFTIDYQSYVASGLGYIVVTVDGRGTGFKGRKQRCAIRGNIGYYESEDQIAAAKMWAAKKYVDAERLAIWGWSYGGFMTLKVLERDQGRTFKYGMAVAPVTDWRFYDSVYTERYMHTPQSNARGYDNASISDMKGLGANVR